MDAYPECNKPFCPNCGKITISQCQHCNANIQGSIADDYEYRAEPPTPLFCHNCGKPYPWTESKILAAKKLVEEMANLSDEEREMFNKSLNDIINENPNTELAATRVKKLLAKAGPVALEGFKQIMTSLITESAKAIILS